MRRESIRVRGLVQGVGFRPTVWRLARECGLRGDVRNDGEGVLARVRGGVAAIDRFCRLLRDECPPLARIDSLERMELAESLDVADFRIVASDAGEVHTGVVADAATCDACRAEIFDPANRHYRYPFTNCTHCGPRLSIVRGIPYDRANTSMSVFPMCADCRREYEDPADRRFHAQPNACPVCGPKVWLEDAQRRGIAFDDEDGIAAASRLLAQGHILAIKGIGGFHLACDACDEQAVSRLRARKRRFRKPFALMGRDLDVIRRYCTLDEEEAVLLSSSAAPIVLLDATGSQRVAAELAPGQHSLGFMLPYSPLHHLLLADWDRPLVMTSGNLSEEPQCIDNQDAEKRLAGLAGYYLLHDREIVNRVDDSVVRVMAGKPRLLRRARGYAPTPIPLPAGFDKAPPILALGGELKNTVCLLKDGQAILSQHLGDLEEARTAVEYERTITLFRALFKHAPQVLAVDLHPDYRSTHLGRTLAEGEGLELVQVQHHFAHIASVLAENGRALDAEPVIGLSLDGLGYGTDGTIWGGEFLLADYRSYRRLAHLKPVPMPGGTKAILEPWRNSYAQLHAHIGWENFRGTFPRLELTGFLERQPLHILAAMLERGLNAPLTSSCGRLFDAVAAALDVSRESISYEGQAAIELEALAVASGALDQPGYPFAVEYEKGAVLLSPEPMWWALLADLERDVDTPLIAARFHTGLAAAVADLAIRLAKEQGPDTVALSGGVLQNRTLFEAASKRLEEAGLNVLSQERVPANDGGIALGQAVVAAATRVQA
ncbi:MAG: carbamoyltransferase HypF [Pseudomonadota bacterium]|nr:carbamoyltransferase HypF [Pseudomonadota bacterium]